MVRISFSVIVLCEHIYLLLVTVGIIYRRAGKVITAVASILFDGENISFDASLVMYINSTSIPPIIIMNRIYENKNLLYIVPLMRHTIVVWISNISPTAKGCFICVNINLFIVPIDIISFLCQGVLYYYNNIIKFSSEVLKGYSLFLI